jgi:hypothetical protein
MGWFAPVVGAVGLGMQVIGQVKEAKAQNQALDYNARVAEQNAQLSQMQADDANRRGEEDARRQRAKAAALRSDQRAAFAASGVMVDSTSALDVLEDAARWGEDDAQTLKLNASKEAWGYRLQGANYADEAKMLKKSKVNPYWGAGGSLLTGASRLAAGGL